MVLRIGEIALPARVGADTIRSTRNRLPKTPAAC